MPAPPAPARPPHQGKPRPAAPNGPPIRPFDPPPSPAAESGVFAREPTPLAPADPADEDAPEPALRAGCHASAPPKRKPGNCTPPSGNESAVQGGSSDPQAAASSKAAKARRTKGRANPTTTRSLDRKRGISASECHLEADPALQSEALLARCALCNAASPATLRAGAPASRIPRFCTYLPSAPRIGSDSSARCLLQYVSPRKGVVRR